MTVPSSHRPVPLLGRPDLQVQEAVYGGVDCVVVKDPVSLDYYRISPIQFRLLKLLDGERPLRDIVQTLQRENPGEEIDLDRVQKMILELSDRNLLWNRQLAGSLYDLRQNQKSLFQWSKLVFQHLFFFRLPGWHAEPVLKFLLPAAKMAFSRMGVVLTGAALLVAGFLLLSRLDELERRLPQLESLLTQRDILTLWLAIGAAKVIHELGHGLACLLQGGRCHGIGVAFLLFSPCLYCDVTDAWMLESKKSRILIALAGIWIEMIVAAVCLAIWWFSAPGLIHDLCLQMCVVTSISTLLFNSNPLMKYDGYYVLCDLIEVPNLQQQAQRAIQESIRWLMFGIPVPKQSSVGHLHRGWLLLYGVCSSAYKWSIVIAIGLFLHHLFKPAGLQFLSWIYVGISGVAAVSSFISMGQQIMKSPGWNGMKMARSAAVWSLFGLGIWGLWNCPVPNRFQAPVVVEPYQVQHVYVDSPGVLVELRASVGDVVEAGTPLLVLDDPVLRDQLVESERVYRQSNVDLQLAQATSDPDLAQLARQSLETARLQILEALDRLERLTVKAPCAGRILSAQGEDLGVQVDAQRFTGQPAPLLHEQNLGAGLERRTPVCSIAPTDGWQTVAWVKEEESLHLSPQQVVEVALDGFPGQRVQGTIERISPAGGAVIPPQLSSRFGGSLLSQDSPQGEVAADKMYQVVISLTECDLPLSLGLRGSARFQRPAENVGQWLIRSFYELFPTL